MTKSPTKARAAIVNAADAAARAIPPAWPLASSVAVNPFLGQSEMSLAETGALVGYLAGESVTMPRDWYAAKIASGEITDEDLTDALAASGHPLAPSDVDALKTLAQTEQPAIAPLKTVADLAAEISGIDWPAFISERFGAWAASYCDQGQALWAAPRRKGAYTEWRNFAVHDLTPEIMGLTGFAARVSDLPLEAGDTIALVTGRMNIPQTALKSLFHQQLLTLGGWSQYARYVLWQAELGGETDAMITDFLAIRMVFADALLAHYGDELQDRWTEICATHAAPDEATADTVANTILQEAAERAGQRKLATLLSQEGQSTYDGRPKMQAAFCIDVRSEVFRRALESVDPSIQTLGFAGFFGLTTAHKAFASDVEELRLPVLLNPGLQSRSGSAADADKDLSTRYAARAKRAWGRFKLAAVSSFAFVEAMGPVYVSRLLRDGLGLKQKSAPNDPMPQLETELDLKAQTDAAETILRAMSLTKDFARLVIIAGHGANVVNNPHASALHCGACGGYSGEVNARLLASLLNVSDVRAALVERGVTIPDDTLFVAGLHDTTTDAVTLYDADSTGHGHDADLKTAREWLAAAGKISRTERALRLPGAETDGAVVARSRNWAEVRPEWALAGCRAFIAAPRRRTADKSLAGTSFLHDYDWKQDSDFSVLELIMTAPVVVASWISLQYYGSVVAPGTFGGGNKLLHNVVGGFGVVEGNGGQLRAGLPWQSVHDGEKFVHEPLRLSVCIEAPRGAMSEIVEKHANVRALFDNKWLHLFALNEDGHMAWRYSGDLKWEAMPAQEAVVDGSRQVD